ncbi:1-3-beta-glucanosyltransferase gel1 [Venturia nashicola]|uniref:Palmitoyltransferase n=1 Tax=Venturia nashicola TaxID=86259 RepID=A0A4Z1P3K8_9PEZI|nr:1-3-beta-glucanosyltransferase gel1 [Venturia nashicola]TLD28121.1 1-3-beta-glucanosyltransferase gel1 [Venturia nashicola]
MASFAPSPSNPSPPNHRRRRSFVRKCERYCCNVITYFPLTFVYGLTSWAVWVQTKMGFIRSTYFGYLQMTIGIAFYILLNWSYTTAVFTDPGSPLTTSPGYSALPTTEPHTYHSLTVKSSGEMRFCKKCQSKKPDRAHHCSTCRKCVLKMDHHCPWLATCVGLRNYKAFLLFLIYTNGTVEESLMPVNFILLSVLSGIIGLVITGFTAWHLYLTSKGQTTIESLEKTRYLSPLKAQQNPQHHMGRTYVDDDHHTLGEQMRDFGMAAAAATGFISQPNDADERASPAQSSLQRTYDWDNAERQRERDRYNEYLDELDNEKLPNAFDYGWRRNLEIVMGENKKLWFLPICNSMGDGWLWEPSAKWKDATEQLRLGREARLREEENQRIIREQMQVPRKMIPRSPPRSTRGLVHHATNGSGSQMPTRGFDTPTSKGRKEDTYDYDTSSDEENMEGRRLVKSLRGPSRLGSTENWNDLPADMVKGRKKSPRGSTNPSR